MNKNLAQRAQDISPFHVMDILAQAKQLEAQGQDIIHMEVGEPDFDTPQPIIDAGIAALNAGKTHYTPALGLPELRQAIADWYQHYYKVTVSADRIVVTPGASGALLLVMGALLERDKKVMLADPGYPCNRNFARFVEGKAQSINVDASSNFQLTAQDIEQHWHDDTAMALVASPSNPTGTLLSKQQLSDLSVAVNKQHGHLVVDEIYHGLTYDGLKATSILELDQNAFVINSFSKFFGMTGWRLGWLVVPDGYQDVMDRLAQNLFLAAPTMSQYAALAAFNQNTLAILEQRRQLFEQRRNALIPALQQLGLTVEAKPQGAFYIYANCSGLLNEQTPNSMALSKHWLQHAGVAVTPGDDFGHNKAQDYIRFAYTTDEQRLLQAIERLNTIRK
ncbi:MAG: pyridoxal phosphate-dependent aminotransferase [Proteobacteria bacterium]|nr:pyridoxal phosphate-dependent aminotransferase [Pseudomonadota bacterium]